MQYNYNSFIQIINFHGLFRNCSEVPKTGACRILVPLRYMYMFSCQNTILEIAELFDNSSTLKSLS